MYPLLVCSFVSLTVIIERAIFWMVLSRHRKKDIVFNILDLAREGNWKGIKNIASGSKNYIVRILIAGIVHREFSMGRAMEAAASDEVKKMRRFMTILDTIITVAPLLGILGTVIGIITSFEVLGNMGIGDPRAVTGGIAQALVSTAAGLTISICTLFPFNYFSSKIEYAALAIEKYATSLEIVWEKQEHVLSGRPN